MNNISSHCTGLDFNVNRNDKQKITEQYTQSGRIHIPDFLFPESAFLIHETLEKQEEWNLALNDSGRHVDYSYTGVMGWTQEQRQMLAQKVHAQAKHDFQYCYAAIPIFDIYHNNLMPGHFFNAIYEFFNSATFIKFVREVTGHHSIEYADMQATRFSNGHFLTEHDDNVRGKNRLAAYVLNLTPEWKNDWGGALIFNEDLGSNHSVLFPSFNALNIFSVPQKHSVSFVTPFANAQRYSITGWLRY